MLARYWHPAGTVTGRPDGSRGRHHAGDHRRWRSPQLDCTSEEAADDGTSCGTGTEAGLAAALIVLGRHHTSLLASERGPRRAIAASRREAAPRSSLCGGVSALTHLVRLPTMDYTDLRCRTPPSRRRRLGHATRSAVCRR